jgi:hypothetical protein
MKPISVEKKRIREEEEAGGETGRRPSRRAAAKAQKYNEDEFDVGDDD